METEGQTARNDPPEVSEAVEHLFRHEAGKMVATLTGIFGIEHLTPAEVRGPPPATFANHCNWRKSNLSRHS